MPQTTDPELVRAYLQDLRASGPMGDALNLADVVLPVYLLGQREGFDLTVSAPAFATGEMFDGGEQTAFPINTVLSDTGPLQAGTFDVVVWSAYQVAPASADRRWEFQHRNAENSANLFTIGIFWGEGKFPPLQSIVSSFVVSSNDERFRVLALTAASVGVEAHVTIGARRR